MPNKVDTEIWLTWLGRAGAECDRGGADGYGFALFDIRYQLYSALILFGFNFGECLTKLIPNKVYQIKQVLNDEVFVGASAGAERGSGHAGGHG